MTVPPHRILLLLLLLVPLLLLTAEAKRQPGQEKPEKPRQPPPSPPPTSRRPRNRSVPGSGELTTKEGHRCTWQTSGEGLVSLLVNCSAETEGELQRYWCRYAGKPDLCQAYGVKSSQYWKQLVGKLKKRQHACDGEKVLKAKTCKKAPAEAHMKLAQRSGEDERRAGKKKAGGGGGAGKAEKRKKQEEEEQEEKKKLEDRTGFEDEEGLLNDMAPVQSYCGEGWHSVCSFFVRFFEG
ncbi:fibroblast growth factor-binding protein 2 [Salarias fasciatus]|uniref:fibroblast growth factor-binding protein 2 n=1 Tax=Salarias fasciatus TaxID=181472 RepID=UPI001176D165|nr:fibroblast growth factor-binding protein 3 [Salarias fasciatus]